MIQQQSLGNINTKLLSIHMEAAACKIQQAETEEDRLIVTTDINIRDSGFESVLVGEDTDIFVLLVPLASLDNDIKL